MFRSVAVGRSMLVTVVTGDSEGQQGVYSVGSCCGAVWVRDYGTVGRAMLVTVVTADSEGQQGVYSVGSCCGAVWVRDYDTRCVS